MFAPDSVAHFAADAVAVTASLQAATASRRAFLVAADGKRSQIRERAGMKCVSWSYAQIGIVTTVAHSRPHDGEAVQHFLPGGPFAILPLKGNRSSIVWTEERRRGAKIMAGDEATSSPSCEALRPLPRRHLA